MMTLIERWNELSDAGIIREMQMLFLNCSNAVHLFTVDENYAPIRYCIDHSSDLQTEKYGKKIGVCFSEKNTRDCIAQIMVDYIFLLIPFLRSDLQKVDLCIQGLQTPIGYYQNDSGEEIEIREAAFVFEKCDNMTGFCVSNVIPLR